LTGGQATEGEPTTEADNRTQRKRHERRPPVDPADRESTLTNLVPILIPIAFSVLLAMTYGMLRSGYVRFYSQYGVSPEDVGISQQQVITGALRFCLAAKFVRSLGGWAPLMIFALLAFYAAVWMVVVRFCVRSRRFMATAKTTRSRVLLVVTIYLSTLLGLLVIIAFYFIGQDQAKASHSIEQFRSVHPADMVFLMVQADPASVVWLTTKEPRPSAFPNSKARVMYLGHTEKMATIYDPISSSMWRVPEDSVLITVKPSAESGDIGPGTKL
jgi:hypothetical protein